MQWLVYRPDCTGSQASRIARFMGPTWGPPGSCRPPMGPILAIWTLLSGIIWHSMIWFTRECKQLAKVVNGSTCFGSYVVFIMRNGLGLEVIGVTIMPCLCLYQLVNERATQNARCVFSLAYQQMRGTRVGKTLGNYAVLLYSHFCSCNLRSHLPKPNVLTGGNNHTEVTLFILSEWLYTCRRSIQCNHESVSERVFFKCHQQWSNGRGVSLIRASQQLNMCYDCMKISATQFKHFNCSTHLF